MRSNKSKFELWDAWVDRTVLADIHDSSTPDPVPVFDDTGDELARAEKYESYRLGRGSGDYLYLLYLLDQPVEESTDVVPVYIGETGQIAGRLLGHFRNIRDALPIADWSDDGSWGSYSKYDHIATVYEQADSPLYIWILETSDIEEGPYGYSTYRHELEAKTVGLAHSYPRFNRVLANRDFVPNRVPQEMAKVGPSWVELDHDSPNKRSTMVASTKRRAIDGADKEALWKEWVTAMIHREIHDPSVEEPVPLFETDENLKIALTDRGVLKRSPVIDARIREEGRCCVNERGVRDDGPNGLVYVMYQLANDDPEPTDIIPRYIGKAEAYGKKNELSANFKEIAKERAATRSFARWGDGHAWHVGELSNTVFGEEDKKLAWASELFEPGTHQLKDQLYLWIRGWDPERYLSPYGHPSYLAETEPLLIGLAYAAYPDKLLNKSEVPSDAPVNRQDHSFDPASR